MLAEIGENFRVETIQSNGLPEVLYPYSIISFFAGITAAGLFFFGVILSLSTVSKIRDNLRRAVLGSGLLAAGLVMVPFAVFLALTNYSDELPRCYSSGIPVQSQCPVSTLQHYNSVYIASAIIVVFGVIACIIGIRFLRGKREEISLKKMQIT